MSSSESIRGSVSKAYAKAVSTPRQGCCGASVPKGIAAKVAGYDAKALAELPEDAVENSFGCGDPLAFAEVRAGDVVVDLGSGAGIDLLLAAKKVGPTGRVIGIDMTPEMIEKARANIKAAGLTNVEVRQGIIEELPVESGTVDWVISNCVINLSPEKPRVFGEIARVLKPGGRMQVSDIVVSDVPDWVRKSAALYSSCVAGAVSEEEYCEGLRQAGLTDVKVLDRFVYDVEQLQGLVDTEIEQIAAASSSCCGMKIPAREARKLVGAVAGKIWSAKVSARKP